MPLVLTNATIGSISATTNAPALSQVHGFLAFEVTDAYLDEGNSARGTHVLSIGPHLDGEVQLAHVEESLDGQAGGVVWEEDLLQLVRLEKLDIGGPGLLGAHLQAHRLCVQDLGGHEPQVRPFLK